MAEDNVANNPDSAKAKASADRQDRKAARKIIARKAAYDKRAKKAAVKAERRAAQKELAKDKVEAKKERKAAKYAKNPKVVDPHKATKVLNRLLTRAAKFEMRGKNMLKEAALLREKHAAQVKRAELAAIQKDVENTTTDDIIKLENDSSSDSSDSSDSDSDSDASSDSSSDDGGVPIAKDTDGDVEMASANAQLRAESEGLSGPPDDVVPEPSPEPSPEPAKEEKKSKKNKDKKKKSKAAEPEIKEPVVEEEPIVEEPSVEESSTKEKKSKKSKKQKKAEDSEKVQETPKNKKKRKRDADAEDEETPAKSDKKQKKKKGKSSAEEAVPEANVGEQWNVSGLGGGSERQSKFLKLLGGGKNGGAAIGQHSGKDKLNISKVNADLEKQFNAGMHMKFDGGGTRRGLGA